MNYIVALFGFFIIVLASFLLIQPTASIEYIRKKVTSNLWYIFAIAIRLVMGTLMYIIADQTRYPLTIAILGITTFLAGVFLVLISRPRVEKIILWFIDRFSMYVRIVAVGAISIGAFLIYAVL